MFDVPDQVEWSRVDDALNKRWVLNNELALDPENMAFLATKLFPGRTPVVLRFRVLLLILFFFLLSKELTSRLHRSLWLIDSCQNKLSVTC